MTTPHPNQTDTRLSGVFDFLSTGSITLLRETTPAVRWKVSGTVEGITDHGGHGRVGNRHLHGYGANPGLAASDFITRAVAVRDAVTRFRTKEREEDALIAAMETQFTDPPPPSD